MSENIEDLKSLINKYEQDGPAKLFYALNRKAWEMAEMLNSINLKSIKLDDPKDKTFERLRFIINDSASVVTAVKALGDTAGITYDEDKDTKNKKYQITTPESISNVLSDK